MRVGRCVEIGSLNVAVPAVLAEQGDGAVWSGIAKRPVGPGARLWLSEINISGDGQADLSVHGGPDKAVYAYPSEHLGAWAAELGEPIGAAAFGENLTTSGATEADTLIGDVWTWGEAILQVSQPRWPCFKLALHRGRPDIQRRMLRSGRTGWYLRVLQPGEVASDAPITLSKRHPEGVSVADAHTAMHDAALRNLTLVRAVASLDVLAQQWRAPLVDRLERRSA